MKLLFTLLLFLMAFTVNAQKADTIHVKKPSLYILDNGFSESGTGKTILTVSSTPSFESYISIIPFKNGYRIKVKRRKLVWLNDSTALYYVKNLYYVSKPSKREMSRYFDRRLLNHSEIKRSYITH